MKNREQIDAWLSGKPIPPPIPKTNPMRVLKPLPTRTVQNTTPQWIVELKARREKELATSQRKKRANERKRMAAWKAKKMVEEFARLPWESPRIKARERFAERLARDED
jgi:hypothetical protein